jgi:hypothetical protein
VPGGFEGWDGNKLRSGKMCNEGQPSLRAGRKSETVRCAELLPRPRGATPEIREPSYGHARNALRTRVCGCILLAGKYILNIQKTEGYAHGR